LLLGTSKDDAEERRQKELARISLKSYTNGSGSDNAGERIRLQPRDLNPFRRLQSAANKGPPAASACGIHFLNGMCRCAFLAAATIPPRHLACATSGPSVTAVRCIISSHRFWRGRWPEHLAPPTQDHRQGEFTSLDRFRWWIARRCVGNTCFVHDGSARADQVGKDLPAMRHGIVGHPGKSSR